MKFLKIFALVFIFMPSTILASNNLACDIKDEVVCKLVDKFATELTAILRTKELKTGDFAMESVSAEKTVVHVVLRTTYTKSALEAALSESGLSRDVYLSIVHNAALNHDCEGPALEIINKGGTFKNTILFKDGEIFDIYKVTACPTL